MIAAVLVPLAVLLAACLLERLETRVVPPEVARTTAGATGAPTPELPAVTRHLQVVRADPGPTTTLTSAAA